MAEFSFATEKIGFDEHIRLSIRGYDDLWNDILKFSRYFIEDRTIVIDIGCSTGKLLKGMDKHNKDHAKNCSYIGIEMEKQFFPKLIDKKK